MSEDPRIAKILFATNDDKISIDGRPVPAMTTLLYRVCGNDPERFEEATRLVELFIHQALDYAPPKPADDSLHTAAQSAK